MHALSTRRLRLLAPALAAVVALAAAGVTASAARADRIPPEVINREIALPGGIKAMQTGGNTIGDDVIREPRPRADGYRHIDTPETIRRLKRLGMNTYVYLVWYSPTDWSDLVNEFAPAAEKAGIRIWVYIVPPSECMDDPVPHQSGRCSRPYGTDYVGWAEAIARLSVEHPNVVAWALDDFFSQLSPDEVAHMREVQDEINPHLGFYTTAYYGDAVNPGFYDRYAGVIDGIIYPYTGANSNTHDASEVGPNLDAILKQTEPRGLGVLMLAYTGRYLSAVRPPTDRYVADVIEQARPYMESGRILGMTLYGLPIARTQPVTAYDRALTGTGWLSFEESVFGATQAGDYAEAEQTISVDPHAGRYGLEFSDYDVYFDEYANAPTYHDRQVLIDGKVVWESDDPGRGGEWRHHFVDLTSALRGKRSATLAIRVHEQTSLNAPTIIALDDVSGHGIDVANGGFERRDGWRLTSNNKVMLPSIDHYADYFPRNLLRAAAAAFRGDAYAQSPATADRAKGDALYGTGRLSLSAAEGSFTPAGACARASQVMDVDPASPRQEVSFWQYSRHAPFPGFYGRHIVRVRLDDKVIWQSDANGIFPIWLNGGGLQGPIDVTDLVHGPTARLTFELCGLEHDGGRPNPPVDIGFDRIQTVGLDLRDPGFEHGGGWTFSSDASGLRAAVARASHRPPAMSPVSVRLGGVVARAGTTVSMPVTVENSSATPLSGELTATTPDGWTLEPPSVPFGPIAGGDSQTVDLHVSVPAGVAPGTYWVTAVATTPRGSARAVEKIQVIGDTIEFTPGTDAEAPWLADPDGSQLDGAIHDGHGRFADGTTRFVYRFDLPPDVTGGSLTLEIGNEYLVDVSNDGQHWRTVLRESREIHDLSNLENRTLDLDDLRAGGSTLFVRIADSKTDDGWGGWLGHLKLSLTGA